MIKAILFDYGGTLDSRGEHWSEVIWQAYMTEGLEALGKEHFREAYVHAERALDGSGIILPDDTFHDVMLKKIGLQLAYLSIDTPEISTAIARRCYDEAKECTSQSAAVLRELSQLLPIGIVSNFYGNLHAVLTDFGLMPYLSTVIDSSVIGVRKPDPKIFSIAIESLTHNISQINPLPSSGLLPEEVLVVGDSVDKDIIPATTIGCLTAHLPGTPWDSTQSQSPLPATTITLSSLSSILKLPNLYT